MVSVHDYGLCWAKLDAVAKKCLRAGLKPEAGHLYPEFHVLNQMPEELSAVLARKQLHI